MNEQSNRPDVTEEAEAVKKSEKKKNSVGKEIFEWFYTIAIALIIAFVIKAFLFDVVRVDGSSMFPTLENNDRLIVTKLGYEPHQGDIVILDSAYKNREAYYDKLADAKGKEELSSFDKLVNLKNLPSNLKKRYYVKRVIAMPGQTVDIQNGKVYVDGEVLDEPYYDGITQPIDSTVEYPITVEEDMVFVMGDNRPHSKDSRSSELGQVPYDAVIGKAQLRIWPLNALSVTK